NIISATNTYTLSLHDALPILQKLQENTATFDFDIFKNFRIQPSDIQTGVQCPACGALTMIWKRENWRCSTCQRAASYAHHQALRSEEHTSELQSRFDLVCRLL